jgi:hypothetical protein
VRYQECIGSSHTRWPSSTDSPATPRLPIKASNTLSVRNWRTSPRLAPSACRTQSLLSIRRLRWGKLAMLAHAWQNQCQQRVICPRRPLVLSRSVVRRTPPVDHLKPAGSFLVRESSACWASSTQPSRISAANFCATNEPKVWSQVKQSSGLRLNNGLPTSERHRCPLGKVRRN